jgi:hypothetical protein
MKNLTKLLLVAAFLLLPAMAHGQGSGSVEPSRPAPAIEDLSRESNFLVTSSVTGTIAGISEGILTVKTKKNKEVRVLLIARTKVKVGKKTMKIDELEEGLIKEGQQIRVSYLRIEDKKAPADKVALEIKLLDKPKES